MKTALLGALLIVAGIAAQIIAGRHVPETGCGYNHIPCALGDKPGPLGWPTATYDAVRVGGWALIVVGAVIVAVALVREFHSG